MTANVLVSSLASLVAAYLMLGAGLAKKRLEWRPPACRSCGRNRLVCRCGRRR